MNKNTQLQKVLEYFLRFGTATISDLNEYARTNWSHKYIAKLVKRGIVSPNKIKTASADKKRHYYTWYREPVDPDKIDVKKCRLKG